MSGTEESGAGARAALLRAAQALNALGINQGRSGNVSVRTAQGFLVTPSGVAYEAMTPDMLVPVTLDGGYRGDLRPSSEWRLHRDIYRHRPDAGAVVHVHSTVATALACLRLRIPAFHYMVAMAGGTAIEVADYATFGTQELSDAMLAALGPRRACLLANHGQIAYGATLEKALDLAVEVEALARQYWHARSLGEPVILTEAEMAEVTRRFAAYGKPAAERTAGDDDVLGFPHRLDG
ncbi:class II aldolase/adducin family protein [Rhodocista pekingensis]|uniref:Class II aldolase/adducin family protein n=1 Tax=Rhodocista pekingensis TaxID=201185 RepID=A0ABW2KVJ1_9PROT